MKAYQKLGACALTALFMLLPCGCDGGNGLLNPIYTLTYTAPYVAPQAGVADAEGVDAALSERGYSELFISWTGMRQSACSMTRARPSRQNAATSTAAHSFKTATRGKICMRTSPSAMCRRTKRASSARSSPTTGCGRAQSRRKTTISSAGAILWISFPSCPNRRCSKCMGGEVCTIRKTSKTRRTLPTAYSCCGAVPMRFPILQTKNSRELLCRRSVQRVTADAAADTLVYCATERVAGGVYRLSHPPQLVHGQLFAGVCGFRRRGERAVHRAVRRAAGYLLLSLRRRV